MVSGNYHSSRLKQPWYEDDHAALHLSRAAIPLLLNISAWDDAKLHIVRKVGNAVAQWLRCCATNRKVAGSIPDGVIGIFS
jgi:hypothetical protein